MRYTWLSTLFCMWALWYSPETVRMHCFLNDSLTDMAWCMSSSLMHGQGLQTEGFYETASDCQAALRRIKAPFDEDEKAAIEQARADGKKDYTTVQPVYDPDCYPVGHNPNWGMQQ